MKKKKIFLITILLLLTLNLVGCKIHPTKVDNGKWYFQDVTIDNVTYLPGEYTKEYHEEYLYDYCLFDFKDAKSIVVYKYYNNEVVTKGTYYVKSGTVNINLDNGDKFIGTANEYYGVSYDFCIKSGNISINLNVAKNCSYSSSINNYYATYYHRSESNLISFFYSKERNDEILKSFAESYDKKISNAFKSLYNDFLNDKKVLFIPNIYQDKYNSSITVFTNEEFNMPWISYICYDEKVTIYDISIMYFDELQNVDNELNESLKSSKYVIREFKGNEYTYFIYNHEEFDQKSKFLVKVYSQEIKEIDSELLDSIRFKMVAKSPDNLNEVISKSNEDEGFITWFNNIYLGNSNSYYDGNVLVIMKLKDILYCRATENSGEYYTYSNNQLIAKYDNDSNVIKYYDGKRIYQFSTEYMFLSWYSYLTYSTKGLT